MNMNRKYYAMVWKVPLFELNYDEREKRAVADVLDSGWITMGERTQEFESSFEKFLGDGSRATVVANGTAALHMAVLALGVGPGDEVIVSALTFIADAMPENARHIEELIAATKVSDAKLHQRAAGATFAPWAAFSAASSRRERRGRAAAGWPPCKARSSTLSKRARRWR